MKKYFLIITALFTFSLKQSLAQGDPVCDSATRKINDKKLNDAFESLQNGDTLQAQKLFLNCVDITKESDSISYWEFQASQKLAKIFYAQKQYNVALSYYYYPKNKYRQFRGICQAGFGRYNKLMAANDLALCYYGLNHKDSVINLLTPLIFNTYYNNPRDSIDIETVSKFYVKMLFEIYGTSNVKKIFKNALHKIKYAQQIIDEPGM